MKFKILAKFLSGLRLKKQDMFFFIALLMLALPMVIYSYQFGFGIWPAHEDWSRMGGALGGIYSPMIALLTLALLYRQQKFAESSHEQTVRTELIRNAVNKGETNVMLAAKAMEKLDDGELCQFRALLELYIEQRGEQEKEEVFAQLYEYHYQLSSLGRAGAIIHHMKDIGIDMSGHITDLRGYAASIMDLETLLVHDSFVRCYMNDPSYYAFDISDEEKNDIERRCNELYPKQ
ncbi:hypothetical protein JRG49_19300 [Pseudomonas fulva]|uniref:hypothetical protein n=1 Tax=Pseudomonas fulva TaxID=47880 RepID=UPI0019D15D90|nr:hypothetical protein [Pseudomonas fulva]MBN6792126.1 hypothetical protein [Pseudomonas fulva]MBN6797094.1 hypothetical protein [Pseudomonas fulva]MBN6857755.1 hypothetical protein [Pseudomonas fulva]MBN6874674.1 hypothetical protein [Pseudomonas fulva]MBN6879095.1 hypothetical protein [Pseudomonas fulva]